MTAHQWFDEEEYTRLEDIPCAGRYSPQLRLVALPILRPTTELPCENDYSHLIAGRIYPKVELPRPKEDLCPVSSVEEALEAAFEMLQAIDAQADRERATPRPQDRRRHERVCQKLRGLGFMCSKIERKLR